MREYRRGDDLRRVHWRSSAHAGELMVRREEQPWQSRATLFVDNRKVAHRGTGAASSLEHAVSRRRVDRRAPGAARLQRPAGHRAGPDQSSTWHEHGARPPRPLPCWSRWRCSTETTHPHIDSRWLQEAGHSGLLIAVLGDVDEHDKPALTRMRHSASGAMAVVARRTRLGPRLGAGAPGDRPEHRLAGGPRLARRLGRARRTRCAAVWQELGTSGRSRQPAATREPAPAATAAPGARRDARRRSCGRAPGVPSLAGRADHLGHAAGLDEVRREPGRLHGAALRRLPDGRGAWAWRCARRGCRPSLVALVPGVLVLLWLNHRVAGPPPSAAGCRPRPRCASCSRRSATRWWPRRRTPRRCPVGAGVLPAADPGRRADRGAGGLPRGRAAAGAAGRAPAAGRSTPRRSASSTAACPG